MDRIQQTTCESFKADRHDGKVHLAPLEAIRLASRAALHEKHLDVGMVTAIFREKLSQQRRNDMRGCSNSQRSRLSALERMCPFSEKVRVQKRPSPQKNISGNVVKGRGVSYVKYELSRTYVGVVAEVEVDRTVGDVRVTKVYVVHDCGQIINPKGVQAQIEGNVIQTVSRTLKEEVTFDRSMVTSLDWASYPILTFPELPEIVN